jgi:Flp pilus assembly pilin Flp
MSRATRILGKLRREERGATLVEFTLLLVPMLIFLMGSLDLGYMMYVRSVLQGALNDVGRVASVETPNFTTAGATLEQKMDAAIKARMKPIIGNATYTIRKSSYYQFSRIGKPEKLVTDVDTDGRYDPGDCWQDDNRNGVYNTDSGKGGIGGADDIVVYHVTLTAPRLLPMAGLLKMPTNYEINVKTTIRNQPYADQPEPPVVC